MEQALRDFPWVQLGPESYLADLEYAYDIAVLSVLPADLQPLLNRISSCASMVGLKINTRKTKYFTTAPAPQLPLAIEGECLEQVDSFRYLGSILLPSGQAKDKVLVRISTAWSAFCRLRRPLFNHNEISLRTKMRVYHAAIRSVLTYGCEIWPLRVEDIRKLEVFDHWCLRRILGTRWEEKLSNEVVRSSCFGLTRLGAALRQRRLRWFGHVLRRPPDDLIRMTLSPDPCSEWRCRSGGQLKTWIATVKSEVELLGLRSVYGTRRWERDWIRFCEELASDRRTWAAAVRDIDDADSSFRRR